jgi:AcrR family transcriptional regulator
VTPGPMPGPRGSPRSREEGDVNVSERASRPLTRQLLCERALAIVDAEGLDALTMRRLAADVGVKAPSLYNHVTGKDDLIEGALRVMRSEFRPPSPAADGWKALLAAIFSEYRRVLTAHPNMMSLAGRRLQGERDSGLDFLIAQGFTSEQAVELWQSLLAVVVGFSMFTSGYAQTDLRGLPDGFARAHQWRDETCHQALLAIMDAYERHLTGPAQPAREGAESPETN